MAVADDRRTGEDFEQINNDRDRNETGRDNEDVIGRNTDDEFDDMDELDEEEENLAEGSE